jgi:hypothetical protein
MMQRAQIDLVDMSAHPSNGFKYILCAQDHFSNFCRILPLTSKRASEVAYNLLINFFLVFGAPMILQSDNGREFVNRVIEELVKLWPSLKIVHGRARHPQSQGSVERLNRVVKPLLRLWCETHKMGLPNWHIGISFVQYMVNTTVSRSRGVAPYVAVFGQPPVCGIDARHLKLSDRQVLLSLAAPSCQCTALPNHAFFLISCFRLLCRCKS